MPKFGKIYYFSPVPSDLLDLIGKFAGDVNRPLKFTLTPKRKFLGTIFVQTPYKRYRLLKQSWIPQRLGEEVDARRVQQYMYDKLKCTMFFTNDSEVLDDLDLIVDQFVKRLIEIRNYSLK